MIEEVLIIGGSHGNEKTGIFIVEHIKNKPLNAYSFNVRGEFGNIEAIERNQRYIDFDFNRSFYNEESAATVEEKRSQEMIKKVKDFDKTFVIDLHTTTANMATTYILNKSDELSRNVAIASSKDLPQNHILETKNLDEKTHFVNRIAAHGFMVEVGPVAQNYLCAKSIQSTWETVLRILKCIDDYNKKIELPLPKKKEYFKEVSFWDFPRDADRKINALVHPDFQGKDFQMVKEEQPIFYQLPDKNIYQKELSGWYACFINEAAYYEKNMAMMLCEKHEWSIKS